MIVIDMAGWVIVCLTIEGFEEDTPVLFRYLKKIT